jgi:hypothetical protein
MRALANIASCVIDYGASAIHRRSQGNCDERRAITSRGHVA